MECKTDQSSKDRQGIENDPELLRMEDQDEKIFDFTRLEAEDVDATNKTIKNLLNQGMKMRSTAENRFIEKNPDNRLTEEEKDIIAFK